uniref:Uncharacterized protein n=1 Tax=Hyaloperonospora arabidopsidis (strain Emoy2) TaxID=559515 RepID=M4BLM4_HYAAE
MALFHVASHTRIRYVATEESHAVRSFFLLEKRFHLSVCIFDLPVDRRLLSFILLYRTPIFCPARKLVACPARRLVPLLVHEVKGPGEKNEGCRQLSDPDEQPVLEATVSDFWDGIWSYIFFRGKQKRWGLVSTSTVSSKGTPTWT